MSFKCVDRGKKGSKLNESKPNLFYFKCLDLKIQNIFVPWTHMFSISSAIGSQYIYIHPDKIKVS